MRLEFLSAARALWNSRLLAVAVVLIIGIGIAANTVVFSILNAVLLRPLPYPDSERLFDISGITAARQTTQVLPAAFDAMRAESGSVESMTLLRARPMLVQVESVEEVLVGQRLAGDGLKAFGTPAEIGRLFGHSNSSEVVISNRLYLRRFGGVARQAIGRVINVDGQPMTIVGVMPPDFETTGNQFDLWAPWRFTAAQLAERGNGGFPMIVRQATSMPPAQFVERLVSVGKNFGREQTAEMDGWAPVVTPLKEKRVGGYRQALAIMVLSVSCLLLIICLNIGCLLVSRGLAKKHELVLKVSLGCSRRRIVTGVLMEPMLLFGVGSLIALLFAVWAIRAVTNLGVTALILPRLATTQLDFWALCVNLACSAFLAVVAAFFPAWYALRSSTDGASRGAGRGSVSEDRLTRFARGGMVAAQVCLSVCLLTGGAMLLKSFDRLLKIDPGFHTNGVLTVKLPQRGSRGTDALEIEAYNRLMRSVEALPGVTSAALTSVLPLGSVQSSTEIAPEGFNTSGEGFTRTQFRSISYRYFSTMGIKLLKGRPFDSRDVKASVPVVVVNDVVAKQFWPGEDPLGKRIATSRHPADPGWVTVVGVVLGVRHTSLRSEPREEIYRPYTQDLSVAYGATLVAATKAEGSELQNPIRQLVTAAFPGSPASDVRSIGEWVDRSVAPPKFYAAVLGVFAMVGALVTAFGVYSVISYTMRQRRREIGVRMSLGATVTDIWKLVFSEGLRLIAPGLVFGAILTPSVGRLLSAHLFGVSVVDPWSAMAAIAVVGLAAAAACCFPALRSSLISPTEALKQE